MKKLRCPPRGACLAFIASVAGTGLAAIPARAEPRLIVVELFTSQACSSCPPADALLRDLARRPDVVALGFHVTYWNGPGWRDPFASDAATERQKAYGRRFNGGQVYTPEIVVDGADDMVGSDRGAVLGALAKPRESAAAPVAFSSDGSSVTIGKGAGRGAVTLIRFLAQRTTDVAGGENAGKRLLDANAVRTIEPLGNWDGSPLTLPIKPPATGEGVAVLVQAAAGPILGAMARGGE